MPNGLFYHYSLDRSISNFRVVWFVLFLRLLLIIEIHVLNASVDTDQTPRSAAADIGLLCLQQSHLWEDRLKWI